VADADVVLAFWDGTICCSLAHEISHEQPSTTMVLLDIPTQHASVEEAVGVAFTLVNAGTATGSGLATPTNTTVRSTVMGPKGRKKGQKHHPHRLTTVTNNGGAGEEI
jgi:hypothetical protein